MITINEKPSFIFSSEESELFNKMINTIITCMKNIDFQDIVSGDINKSEIITHIVEVYDINIFYALEAYDEAESWYCEVNPKPTYSNNSIIIFA